MALLFSLNIYGQVNITNFQTLPFGGISNSLTFHISSIPNKAGYSVQAGTLSDYVLSSLFSNVKDFGAIGNGIADDSLAIQATIDSITNTGGTVFFPPGVYLITTNFTQKSGSGTFAQLHLPLRDIASQAFITIKFLGAYEPPDINGAFNPSTNGSVIFSKQAGSGTNYCIIGETSPSGSSISFNGVYGVFQNLTFRQTNDPSYGCLDFRNMGAMKVVDCNFDINTNEAGVQYANSATALSTPQNGNWCKTIIEHVGVLGYNVAYELNEHTAANDIQAFTCGVGMVSYGGFHSVEIGQAVFQNTLYNFIFNATTVITVQNVSVEHAASGHFVISDDIYDPTGNGHGYINYNVIQAGTGYSTTWNVNGGANLDWYDIHRSLYTHKVNP